MSKTSETCLTWRSLADSKNEIHKRSLVAFINIMHTAAVMITTVATWRCKCGVGVKVVAEADEQKPTATVVATCPDCGDKQIVHAHRIIEVTSYKGENALR